MEFVDNNYRIKEEYQRVGFSVLFSFSIIFISGIEKNIINEYCEISIFRLMYFCMKEYELILLTIYNNIGYIQNLFKEKYFSI